MLIYLTSHVHFLSFCCREVVERVLEDIPYDPTDLEDVIHAQLLTGEVAKALTSAERLDVWLSCHLADVMNALGLLQDPEEGEDAEEYAYLPLMLTSDLPSFFPQNWDVP